MLHAGGAIPCIGPLNTGAQDLRPNLMLSGSNDDTITVRRNVPLGASGTSQTA